MKTIHGLLSFIYGLTTNYAVTYCYDYCLTDSTCCNTQISDDVIYCYGYLACGSTEITATNTVLCDGFRACSYSDQIESTGGHVLCSISHHYTLYIMNDSILTSITKSMVYTVFVVVIVAVGVSSQ